MNTTLAAVSGAMKRKPPDDDLVASLKRAGVACAVIDLDSTIWQGNIESYRDCRVLHSPTELHDPDSGRTLRLFPGVREFAAALRAADVPLAVASASPAGSAIAEASAGAVACSSIAVPAVALRPAAGGAARRARRRPTIVLSIMRATQRRWPGESARTFATISGSCGTVSEQRADAAPFGVPSTGASEQNLLARAGRPKATTTNSTNERIRRPHRHAGSAPSS